MTPAQSLHLCNLTSRGMSMADARKLLGLEFPLVAEATAPVAPVPTTVAHTPLKRLDAVKPASPQALL
jgi:hypothetical protein